MSFPIPNIGQPVSVGTPQTSTTSGSSIPSGGGYTNINTSTATQTAINDISQGNISFGKKSLLDSDNALYLGLAFAVVAAIKVFKGK